MKKANLLIDILYCVGLGLAFALFFTFVPEVNRTKVAWLNFSLGLLIYTGYLGRLMVIFRPLCKFADTIPFMTTYWTAWTTYVAFTVSGMLFFHLFGMPFRKQALLQGVMFFVFTNVMAFGIWGAAWMTRSSARDKKVIGGIRNLQHMASTLQISASELPENFMVSKMEVGKIVDDINCIAGSSNENAAQMEERIMALVATVSQKIIDGISNDELLKLCKELRMAVSMRKAI